MAFVLHAFGYLHSDGEIVAILPAGSVTSEKDREAWHQLRKHASVDIISHHDHKTFGDCFPTTRLIHIRRTDSAGNPKPKKACHTRPLRADDPVIIHRGTIQMHSIPKGKSPLAHSTDVSDFRITLNGHKAKAGHSAVSGHFVAICRVGDPKKEKVALHYSRSEVAISDCLVALCCSSKANARDLHSQIVKNWPKLAILYGGTGAKYITISKLATFIRQIGFSVAPHANAKSQLRRSVAEYS